MSCSIITVGYRSAFTDSLANLGPKFYWSVFPNTNTEHGLRQYEAPVTIGRVTGRQELLDNGFGISALT